MDFDYILEKLSEVRELPENVDELFEQLQIEDIFTMFFASFTVETKSPEDLETLRIDLEDNVRQNKNHETDPFISNVWEVAAEESIAKKFDVNLIRSAISLGLYPMSAKIDSLFFPTFKYHLSKCIITFDKLHISRNVKKYITKYFSDYTVAFNLKKSIQVQMKPQPLIQLKYGMTEKLLPVKLDFGQALLMPA